jgi:ABC-type transport system involved in Fe-S cluster assembly fused permease/ATPase subunit
MSAGDLVMIQGLLLQLWAPLQFLGWFYRELRSSLVDMEDFFAILRTKVGVCKERERGPWLRAEGGQEQ